MLNEEVRNIMKKDPTVVHPKDTIAQVSELMVTKKLQQLPVVDDEGKLEGIITSYDLWKQLRNNTGSDNQLVSDVMSKNVIIIEPKDKVGTAAELFVGRRFKTIPVVNIDNKLKGVITAFDVIRHVMQKEYPPHAILFDKYEDK